MREEDTQPHPHPHPPTQTHRRARAHTHTHTSGGAGHPAPLALRGPPIPRGGSAGDQHSASGRAHLRRFQLQRRPGSRAQQPPRSADVQGGRELRAALVCRCARPRARPWTWVAFEPMGQEFFLWGGPGNALRAAVGPLSARFLALASATCSQPLPPPPCRFGSGGAPRL
jgi:hypothetical protein